MTPGLDERLGRVIRTKRILLGLSQEALGKRIGVRFQQIQKYEKGTNQVSFARLVELADALGTSVGELAESAIADKVPALLGSSEREMLEMVKRYRGLTPAARQGISLLVRSLSGEQE